jgi:hypothetical protein
MAQQGYITKTEVVKHRAAALACCPNLFSLNQSLISAGPKSASYTATKSQ